MDILALINEELEMWEARKQAAISEYTLASNALQVLWSLTERMKHAAEQEDEDNKYNGKKEEASSGNGS
jgi:hypothetical protein